MNRSGSTNNQGKNWIKSGATRLAKSSLASSRSRKRNAPRNRGVSRISSPIRSTTWLAARRSSRSRSPRRSPRQVGSRRANVLGCSAPSWSMSRSASALFRACAATMFVRKSLTQRKSKSSPGWHCGTSDKAMALALPPVGRLRPRPTRPRTDSPIEHVCNIRMTRADYQESARRFTITTS